MVLGNLLVCKHFLDEGPDRSSEMRNSGVSYHILNFSFFDNTFATWRHLLTIIGSIFGGEPRSIGTKVSSNATTVTGASEGPKFTIITQ